MSGYRPEVLSVNGKRDNVALDAADVGADVAGTAAGLVVALSDAIDTALESKADLVDGKVPEDQLPEMAGSITTGTDTDITGILKGASGKVAPAEAGADYRSPTDFVFPGATSSNPIIIRNGIPGTQEAHLYYDGTDWVIDIQFGFLKLNPSSTGRIQLGNLANNYITGNQGGGLVMQSATGQVTFATSSVSCTSVTIGSGWAAIAKGGGNGTTTELQLCANTAATPRAKLTGANEFVLGSGDSGSSPSPGSWKGVRATGTNTASGTQYFDVPQSTGNATPGKTVLRATEAGPSGATAQTLIDVLTISNLLAVLNLAVLPTADPSVEGAIWRDGDTLKVSIP